MAGAYQNATVNSAVSALRIRIFGFMLGDLLNNVVQRLLLLSSSATLVFAWIQTVTVVTKYFPLV